MKVRANARLEMMARGVGLGRVRCRGECRGWSGVSHTYRFIVPSACCLTNLSNASAWETSGMCRAPTPISHTRGRAGCPADFLVPQSDAEDDGFSLSLSALTFSPRWAASETRNYLPAARPRGISSPDSQPRPNGGQIRAGLRGRASHPRVPIPNTSRRVACVGTHPKSLPNCRSAVAPRPDPMDGMACSTGSDRPFRNVSPSN